MLFENWPDWLTGPAVAAVIAALGYVAKLAVEAARGVRSRRADELTRLIRLEALLDASRSAYLTQVDLRSRLVTMLMQRFPETFSETRGVEWNFDRHFDDLNDDELALQRVIRAYTEHAIRPLNVDTLAWLDADDVFRAGRAKHSSQQLTDMLRQLNKHLLMWLAKYQVWIPDEPRHALVYLADEEGHGIGFPKGIEDVLRATIREYQG